MLVSFSCSAATECNMSHQLTAEQQRKIEENRRKALERRAQRLAQTISTNNQSSVQIQPPKQSIEPDRATIAHHGDMCISSSAPKRFAPPRKDAQTSNIHSQGLKHQQFSCNQIGQSTHCNSASSRQVRLVHTLLNISFLTLSNLQHL